MKKVSLIVGLLLAVTIAVSYFNRERLFLAYLTSGADEVSLVEIKELIGPFVEIDAPPGTGPFPVMLQFHGCAGPRMAFMRQWASVAHEAGFATIIVNSTKPRGYNRESALETVCKGKALLGIERTRDVAAAIEIARSDPRLDTQTLVLAGWSHGAWTVMDFLTMDYKKHAPLGMTLTEVNLPRIKGAVLIYPHCGPGALSRLRGWQQSPPILALIAEEDTVVDAPQCIKMFSSKINEGAPIDMVVYPGVDHVFDDITLLEMFPEYYDEDATTDAMSRVRAFLISLNVSEQ